jgi:NitT/TauT family transport system substrate-binding protein
VPDAIKLTGASAFYPKAAIICRWAAATDCYEPNKLIRGFSPSLHLSIIK